MNKIHKKLLDITYGIGYTITKDFFKAKALSFIIIAIAIFFMNMYLGFIYIGYVVYIHYQLKKEIDKGTPNEEIEKKFKSIL